MKFKDFEIRPATFLDGHKDPDRYEVVKWQHASKPFEATNLETGEKHMMQDYCFCIATLIYDPDEGNWCMESVGTRFMEYYEEGLNQYILSWIAMANICRNSNNQN